jgi:Spy/CpxP family protein refolding chaperone
MSTTRNRNLLIIITVLLLTNIGMLAYFLGQKKNTKPCPPVEAGRVGVAEMLQKEVGFTEEQTAKYKEMKEKQKQRIKPMYDNMRKAKDSLFRLLSFPDTPDSSVNKAAEVIAQQQKEIDLETFNHFKRVRTLCTPGQETNFDSMVIRMFRKMGKPVRHNEQGKPGESKK